MDLDVLVIAGDGSGQETVPEGVKSLNAVAEKRGHTIRYTSAELGSCVYEKRIEGMSEAEIKDIKNWDEDAQRRLIVPQETTDAINRVRDKKGIILFGSAGNPEKGKPIPPKGLVEKYGILEPRKIDGLMNNRPLWVDPILAKNSIINREPVAIPGITFVCPEESLFNGDHNEYGSGPQRGVSTRKQFTTSKLEKTLDSAFRQAIEEGKPILCANKYNVLKSEERLSDMFAEFAKKYEGQVQLATGGGVVDGQIIIDNACMQLAANPTNYANTIIVVDEMFKEFLQTIVDVAQGSARPSAETIARVNEEGVYRTFIRELCGGLYFGESGMNPDVAFNSMTYDWETVQNVVKLANSYREKQGHNTVDSMEQEGIPTFDKIWHPAMAEYAADHSVNVRHLSIREAVTELMVNPYALGVGAGSNMMYDLMTDTAGSVAGCSLGLLGSAEINADGFGNYQQIAGTAPDIAGRNIANPIGAIRSVAMLLNDFGDPEGAQIVYRSCIKALEQARTADVMEPGYKQVGTREMGSLVAAAVMAD